MIHLDFYAVFFFLLFPNTIRNDTPPISINTPAMLPKKRSLFANQRTNTFVDTVTLLLNLYALVKSDESVSVTFPALSVATILTDCSDELSLSCTSPE